MVINLPVVENVRRNIRSVHQERNLPSPPMNIAAIPVLPIELQTATSGDQFNNGAGAADRIIAFESVQARQLLVQSEIDTEMVLLRSAQKYSTSCTLFTRNTMVESLRASLLSYPIKLKLLTKG